MLSFSIRASHHHHYQGLNKVGQSFTYDLRIRTRQGKKHTRTRKRLEAGAMESGENRPAHASYRIRPVASAADSADAKPAPPPSSNSLLRVAGFIGSTTFISKGIGALREISIATVFGVGPVADAYSYASIIPSFFMSMLGGINGPLHTSITTVVSKRSSENTNLLIQRARTVVFLTLTPISLLIFVFARQLMGLMAPGMRTSTDIILATTRELSISQLRVMAPCAVLSGFIGVGFGHLASKGRFFLPSISPAFSSIFILALVASFRFSPFHIPELAPFDSLGSSCLAIGTTLGAGTQAIVQILALRTSSTSNSAPSKALDGSAKPFTFADDIQALLKIMLPASVSTGMLYFATYTDIFFASSMPGAAAAMGYANLLIQAPVGIVSSALLIPLVPLLSRQIKIDNRDGFKSSIEEFLVISALLVLPISSAVMPLAAPIVSLVFERYAFDSAASSLVASLLAIYSTGAWSMLVREILIRGFYALDDPLTPFRISIFSIIANVILDILCVKVLDLGVQGLVIATVSVSLLSSLLLFSSLWRQIDGLDSSKLIRDFSWLALASGSSILTCHFLRLLTSAWGSSLLGLVSHLAVCGFSGTMVFFAIALIDPNGPRQIIRSQFRL